MKNTGNAYNPANDVRKTPYSRRNQIQYTFVNEDNSTVPVSCTIRLGDVDPLTGKLIDPEIFRRYHAIVDSEIYFNLKATHSEPMLQRRAKKQQIWEETRSDFIARFGYEPSTETLSYLIEEKMINPNVRSLDDLSDREGGEFDPVIGSALRDEAAERSFDQVLEDMDDVQPLEILHAYAASLTGRLADVYEAMILRYAGGERNIKFVTVARKWGVSQTQIGRDQQKIMRDVRKAIEKARKERGALADMV